MTPRVKASDVARAAGVSTTTVSFVLNGRAEGNIAAATAQRVRDVADELGYSPDRVAQSLRLQRTHVLGLVTDAIASSPFAGRLVGGAVDRAADDGYMLLLFDSQERPDREQQAVDELARRRVDGLIYASMGLRRLDALPATTLPIVLANCLDAAGRHDAIIPDDAAAGRAAAEHLLALGHRRIVMLSGRTSGPKGNIAARSRSTGFRAAMRAAGVPSVDSPVVATGWQIENGYAGALRVLTDDRGELLPSHDRPTAVFAITDRCATGVLLAAGRLGLRVPEDLSVVGFDDQEQLAANVVPALTTFALPHRQMGELAAQRLLADLRGSTGDASAQVQKLPCPLIVRESTGPVPTH